MADLIFTESVGEQPLKVDREKGIVYDVKICGRVSGNRRRYRSTALEKAKALYEGQYVNVDHGAFLAPDTPRGRPVGSVQKRNVTEKFAKLTGVYTTDDGLFAKEMRCNVAHPFTPQLLWWAENDPQAVALSHIAIGPEPKVGPDGFADVVEITSVKSVDVVGTGGTNVSLFESRSDMDNLGPAIRALFAEGLSDEAITKIVSDAVKPIAFSGDTSAALDALKGTNDPRVRVLIEDLDARIALDAQNAMKQKAVAACNAAKLGEKATTAVFIESLTRADESQWPALIEDRLKLFSESAPNPPKSGDPNVKPSLETFLRHVKASR